MKNFKHDAVIHMLLTRAINNSLKTQRVQCARVYTTLIDVCYNRNAKYN